MGPHSGSQHPAGVKLLDRLVEERRIDEFQYHSVLHHAQRTNGAVEDALVETGIFSEADLLKWLAGIFSTRFVSSSRLARAEIDRAALKLLPRRLAERLLAFPILYEQRSQTLSVVSAHIEEHDVGKQVQLATNVREVKVYLARPAAIRASIRKHYYGEVHAFASLEGASQTINPGGNSTMPGAGGDVVSAYASALPPTRAPLGLAGPEPSTGTARRVPMPPDVRIDRPSSVVYPGTPAARPPMSAVNTMLPETVPGAIQLPPDPGMGMGMGMPDRPPSSAAPPPRAPIPIPLGPASPPPIDVLPMPAVRRPGTNAEESRPGSQPTALRPGTNPEGRPPTLESEPQKAGVGPEEYLEILNVMVALLEHNRGELRGHTAHVARLCRKVCERVGVSEEQTHGVLVAAYLHDIGKASNYHLTALNVAQYEGHRVQAQKTYLTPLRIFESVKLPKMAVETLTHQYERWDGKGFPDRLSGKDIPLGARVLAMVETYADITAHAKNPYRRKLDAKEACEVLQQHARLFFDPNLTEVFRHVVLGDDLKSKLMHDAGAVLVIDPDPEETTVLEMRLIEHGYQVSIERGVPDALDDLGAGGIDLVITEVELSPMDGFSLLGQMRERKLDVPVLFLTKRGDRQSVTRGFELGAADYVVKPASADVVVAKVRQILDRAKGSAGGRGVTGSLREMSLPDVIQILSNGRKSGRLTIRADGTSGDVHFGDGYVHNARFGALSGEEAFYAMLMLTDGEFILDPTSQPTERVIHASTESLLLEGMRRLDESGR